MNMAKATIEAMREPTKEMIDAAQQTAIRFRLPTGDDYWRAMIDAALQEGKETVG